MSKKVVPARDIFLLFLFVGLIAFMISMIRYSTNEIKLERIQAYGNWYVFMAIVSGLVIAIEFYRNNIIDRAIWTLSLFFCICSIVFLSNAPVLTYYYDAYTSEILFLSLIIVGMITTFFSPAGFVGVLSDDKKAVRNASWKLLGISILCAIWSLLVERYGFLSGIYATLPILLWRWAYDRWGRQLRGEKSKSDWSFKW